MTRGTRWLLAIVIGGVVVVVAAIGAAAAAVYRGGTVAVEIEGDAGDFRVSLPAGLVGAAIALAPSSMIEEAAHEIEGFAPALDAAWQELADAPDFVLVEVRSAEEALTIEKVGRALRISAVSGGSHVRVAVPLATVGSLLRRLEHHG